MKGYNVKGVQCEEKQLKKDTMKRIRQETGQRWRSKLKKV